MSKHCVHSGSNTLGAQSSQLNPTVPFLQLRHLPVFSSHSAGIVLLFELQLHVMQEEYLLPFTCSRLKPGRHLSQDKPGRKPGNLVTKTDNIKLEIYTYDICLCTGNHIATNAGDNITNNYVQYH